MYAQGETERMQERKRQGSGWGGGIESAAHTCERESSHKRLRERKREGEREKGREAMRHEVEGADRERSVYAQQNDETCLTTGPINWKVFAKRAGSAPKPPRDSRKFLDF